MSVAVVIVTYNGEKWIRRCLDSIKASSRDCSIIIVDNDSHDSTIEIIEEDYHDVRLIRLSNNIGFGQANNIGIYYALESGFEYIFLVNQDTHLSETCIEELWNVSQSTEGYGVISPVHLSYDGTELNPAFSNYMAKSNSSLLSAYMSNNRLTLIDVGFVAAAFWFIPRSVLLEVGGFDPVYFLYGEDNDLMMRILKKGYNAGVCIPARAYHYHTHSSALPNSRAVQKRSAFNEFIEIVKRPDSAWGVAWLRLLRRVFGHLTGTVIYGFGWPLGVTLSALVEVISKAKEIGISRKNVCCPRAFLTKGYITKMFGPITDVGPDSRTLR